MKKLISAVLCAVLILTVLAAGVAADYSTPEEIVNALYALEKNAELDGGPYTLTGVITNVDTAYNPKFGNVTVTMVVGNMTAKPVQCYRLEGDGADQIDVGDEITVEGKLKHYYNSKNDTSTYEFDAGCTLKSYKKASSTPTYTTPEEIVNALYALEKGKSLAGGPYTLTGVITSVDTEYSEANNNVTVTMVVGDMTDKPVTCYRLTGDGADKIGAGDEITVKGSLKHYYNKTQDASTYEFDAGCEIVSYKLAEKPVETEPETTEPATTEPASTEPATTEPASTEPEETKPAPDTSTPAKIAKAAYDLEVGEVLGTFTLSGKITVVNTLYSEKFDNVTVTIVVEGAEDYPIQCFRMINGEGVDAVDKIGVGDEITVTGSIKRYNDTTVEFDANCTLDAATINEKEPEQKPEGVDEILEALYALKDQETLAGPFTLTGTVKSIDTEYSEEFDNVTVTIVVDGHSDKPVMCYRMKGEGASQVRIGDVIEVTGSFKNYRGTYEFAQDCTFKFIKRNGSSPDTSDAAIGIAVFAAVSAVAAAGVIVAKKKAH